MKLLSDTSDEARRRLIEHWRSVSPEEKLAVVARLNRTVLALAQARQDAHYPDATPEERDRLDRAHLERWARELGVADLLGRALADRSGGF